MTPKDLEDATETLRKMAGSYPESTPEHSVLKLASEALLFAFREEVKAKFEAFVARSAEKLSPEQLARLKSMGLEP